MTAHDRLWRILTDGLKEACRRNSCRESFLSDAVKLDLIDLLMQEAPAKATVITKEPND